MQSAHDDPLGRKYMVLVSLEALDRLAEEDPDGYKTLLQEYRRGREFPRATPDMLEALKIHSERV